MAIHGWPWISHDLPWPAIDYKGLAMASHGFMKVWLAYNGVAMASHGL